MPNIFDGIRKMSDEDVRLEIALITQTNLLNAAKETGNKLVNSLADAANSFMQAFASSKSIDYQIVRVSDMVRKNIIQLHADTRSELEIRLKELIAQKCGLTAQESLTVSEERLSFLAAVEAAKLYNITKYDTPANKIENVSIYYNEAFIAALHQCLVRQDAKDVADTDLRIQKRIDEISIEDKRELHKRLMPKEFSGKGIGRILRLEKKTTYLKDVIQILGVQVFDEIAAYVTASVNVLKSFKRISCALMAQLVWKAKNAYGTGFGVNEKSLPSYTTEENGAMQRKEITDFHAMLKEIQTQKAAVEEYDKKLDRLYEQVSKTGEKLQSEKDLLEKERVQFDKLASQKDEYNAGKHSESDTKLYYSEVNNTNRRIGQYEQSVSKLEQKMKELDISTGECENNKENAAKEAERMAKEAELREHELSEIIKNKWGAFYYKMTFEDEVFVQAVTLLTLDGRIAVERMMKEFHDTPDSQAFDTPSSSGCIICDTVADGQVKLYHEGTHITKIGK